MMGAVGRVCMGVVWSVAVWEDCFGRVGSVWGLWGMGGGLRAFHHYQAFQTMSRV